MTTAYTMRCQDCDKSWKIYELKKSCYCPYCGDDIQVVRVYKKDSHVYWRPKEQKKLLEMFNRGCSIKEMATELNRSCGSVDGKLTWLRKQGFIERVKSPGCMGG